MPVPRKYIILIFLVFALLFIGIYFIPQFSSAKNQSADAMRELYPGNPDSSKIYTDGKILFQNKCAACHAIQIDLTGPALTGVAERGPWTNRKNIYDFLKNPMKFRMSDKYMQELRTKYPAAHPAYLMNDKDVDAILRYIDLWNK